MNYLKIYVNFLKKFLNPQRKLKIVFDCSNGTAGLVLKQILNESKIKNKKSPSIARDSKFIFFNSRPDGNFPNHNPDPLKKNAVQQLQINVKKQKADFGIIFDADADRVFFIDDIGRFIDPDIIAWLLIWHLKPKKAVVDALTGWTVKNFKFQISNFKIIESQTGHYFIKKLMRKNKAGFGAEHSGHYYFSTKGESVKTEKNFYYFYYDSGILAAIEAINAISKLPYKLSDFIDLLPQIYRASIELKFKNKNSKKLLEKIENHLKSHFLLPVSRFSSIIPILSRLDGLTMKFPDWWFNIRLSNTEPLIRLNIEANSKKILRQKIREIKKIIQ